jgi:hypothetical protein
MQGTGSFNYQGSISATSFTGSLLGTASYATQALSASWAPSAVGAAFPYTGSAGITGSLSVTGPTLIKANVNTTSSNIFAVQNAAGENMIRVIGGTDVFIGNNAGGTGYGYNNIAIGTSSLRNNYSGTNNIAIGNDSLLSNTDGDYNIAIGQSALGNATDVNNTVAIGLQAGESFTGTDSVIIGHLAGTTTNDESVLIGSGTNTNGGGSNQIVIGYSVAGQGANTAIIGNSNLIGIYNGLDSTTWDIVSDARDKTNISTLTEGLSFINQIRPVQYEWNKRDGSRVGKKQIGFIAQELLAAQTGSAIQDHLYLANTSNPDSLTINQSDLIPILVKAIQDLSAEVENLKQQINP